MVQICRLENIEHKSMKQVSYSRKYFLSGSRAHHSHLQFSVLVGDAFCPHFLHAQVFNYCVCRHHLLVKIFYLFFFFSRFFGKLLTQRKHPRLQKRTVDENDELYQLTGNIYHDKKLVSYFYVLYSQVYISVPQLGGGLIIILFNAFQLSYIWQT